MPRLKSRGPLPCGVLPGAIGADGVQQGTVPLTVALGIAGHLAPSEPPLRCYLNAACAKPRATPTVAMRVSPRRDRRAPVRLTAAGSFDLPVNALDPCAGTVTLTFTRRGRRITTRTVPVSTSSAPTGPDCLFTTNVLLARRPEQANRLKGRIVVRASYSGTTELLPATTTTQIRIG